MAATPEIIEWYLGRDGQQYGPLKDVEVRKLAELGHLRQTDLLWRAGFAEWRPALDVATEILAVKPPAAPAAPSDEPAAASTSTSERTGDVRTDDAPARAEVASAERPAEQDVSVPASAGSQPVSEGSIKRQDGASTDTGPTQGPGATTDDQSRRRASNPTPSPTDAADPVEATAPMAARPEARPQRESYPSGQVARSVPKPVDDVRHAATPAIHGVDHQHAHGRVHASPDPRQYPASTMPHPGIDYGREPHPFNPTPPEREPVDALDAALDEEHHRREGVARKKQKRRTNAPSMGRRVRRVATVVGLPVLLASAAAAGYVYREPLIAVAAKASHQLGGLIGAKAPDAGPNGRADSSPSGAASARLAGDPMWTRIKTEFPEWYAERMRETDRLIAAKSDDAAIDKYLAESLVSLRRGHTSDAFAASPELIRQIAASFVENLTDLRKHSVAACYNFISHGEGGASIVEIAKDPVVQRSIARQLNAVFDAIADGRKQPQTHLPPRKADYDVLADELVKRGWTDNDLQVFSDPRLLARAPSERVCALVMDWFQAHLAVTDPNVQLRLLIESLKPVVSG